MIGLPTTLGVKVIVHELEAAFPPPGVGNVQLVDGVKVPAVPGLTLQVTVPVGVMWPLPLSVTVAVHVTEVPTRSGLGVHVTLVVVSRTTKTEYVDELPVCSVSPGYDALRVMVSIELTDVYVTEHVPVAPRLHAVDDSEPSLGLKLQETVPVGIVPVPGDVSNTLAVHVVVLEKPIGFGEQLMLNNVDLFVTDSAYVPVLGK